MNSAAGDLQTSQTLSRRRKAGGSVPRGSVLDRRLTANILQFLGGLNLVVPRPLLPRPEVRFTPRVPDIDTTGQHIPFEPTADGPFCHYLRNRARRISVGGRL
jgi:hypothetical protein